MCQPASPARAALACALCLSSMAAAAPLRFSVPEGQVRNEFFRDGPVAAHVVLRSGAAPRFLVAFPAGNSGAALWFEALDALEWMPVQSLRPAEQAALGGGVLRGVSVEVAASGGRLAIRRALLGSVRTLREYEDAGRVPAGVEVAPRRVGRALVWERRRLDGAAGYRLVVEPIDGDILGGGAEPLVLAAAPGSRLRLRITALTGDEPLMPIGGGELVTNAAASDPRLRQALEFLSYEDRLLAGSWRFNTYFGRDTLMTICLLAPVLQPRLAEAGLQSVLHRLGPGGEVAHEEDIGEFAILRRLGAGESASDAPIYDYRMVDDDFLLAIAAATYFLDVDGGRAQAAAFLARDGASGRNGAALARNLQFVVAAATPFARDPDWRHLIGLKPGEVAGNWRDSTSGLGHGRYPYDVNAVLVPAALAAIARLRGSGLLDPYLDEAAAADLRHVESLAQTWRSLAPPLFEVRVAPARAREAISAYSRVAAVDARPALQALGDGELDFRAIALDAGGRAIPILHSDESIALFLLEPDPDQVARMATTLTRPFPAGLMTGAGLLVANPAFASAGLQAEFGRNRYHGTVVWSWQQALLRAGLERQLARRDLPPAVAGRIKDARTRLRAAMDRSHGLRGAELWSWSWSNGRYSAEPFGQGSGDETESNAAQLWSTVLLAWPEG